MFIGFIIAIPVFDIPLANITDFMSNSSSEHYISFMKFLQTLQAIGLFTVPPLLAAYLFAPSVKGYLGMKRTSHPASYLSVAILMFLALPLINLTAFLNAQINLPDSMQTLENWLKFQEEAAQGLIESFLDVKTTGGLLFNVFLIGVLPAIGEELAFRGIVQKLMVKWTKNAHWGIFIAAFLFSAMHMQFYGFIPRFLLGMLFGYLYYWSGSIWLPMIAHFINNTTAVLAYHFLGTQTMEQMDNMGLTTGSIIVASVSLLMGGWLLLRIRKMETTRT